jgi:lycopene cyclase domain-containing protein
MSLYGWLIIATISGPFILSFDKKVGFYGYWKALLPSIFIVGCLFLLWDEYFTQEGIWGFNGNYLLNIFLGHLPIEEVCFFLVVPYACVFIYEVLKAYFPDLKLSNLGRYFGIVFTVIALVCCFLFPSNWYTMSACMLSAVLTIGIYFVNRAPWYGQFVLTYLVALLPFIIVNGVLTGAVTQQPIVWYNESHMIGPRIITIPVEDLFYNYALLLLVTTIYEYFKTILTKKNTLKGV